MANKNKPQKISPIYSTFFLVIVLNNNPAMKFPIKDTAGIIIFKLKTYSGATLANISLEKNITALIPDNCYKIYNPAPIINVFLVNNSK